MTEDDCRRLQARLWEPLSRQCACDNAAITVESERVLATWDGGAEPEPVGAWLTEQLPDGARVILSVAQPSRLVIIRLFG